MSFILEVSALLWISLLQVKTEVTRRNCASRGSVVLNSGTLPILSRSKTSISALHGILIDSSNSAGQWCYVSRIFLFGPTLRPPVDCFVF